LFVLEQMFEERSIMSAQIIEFPMHRVRPAQAQNASRATGVRQARPLPQSEVRTSVRIARSIVGWLLVAMTVFWLFYGQGSLLQSAQANSQGNSAQTTKFEYVTVMSGQSLWSIAEIYGPNQDPQDFIAKVISLNNLSDSVVPAGMRLALPKN
ncbi:MAG: LysM peptidoglycan-binding domain-containing protein, partial [Actinomycetes bacterium]